jgi:deoxycytidylate deaminase
MSSKRRYSIRATTYDKRGRVISIGYNDYDRTHPTQAMWAERAGHPQKLFLHAEIAALVKCRGNPYKIKIERYDMQGRPKLAKPCAVCELAIKEAGIKFVEYTVG